MTELTEKEKRNKEYAISNFNSCDHAGAFISIEVDKETGTKAVLGYCDHEKKKIDIEPTCRICLRHTRKKKSRASKKTAVKRARISKGRLRQKQREAEKHDPFIKRPGLDSFSSFRSYQLPAG